MMFIFRIFLFSNNIELFLELYFFIHVISRLYSHYIFNAIYPVSGYTDYSECKGIKFSFFYLFEVE